MFGSFEEMLPEQERIAFQLADAEYKAWGKWSVYNDCSSPPGQLGPTIQLCNPATKSPFPLRMIPSIPATCVNGLIEPSKFNLKAP